MGLVGVEGRPVLEHGGQRQVVGALAAEDIGARRLHAIFEQLLEDVSFNAGDENMPPFELKIDGDYVNAHLKGENKPMDIKKYIL